MAISVGSIVPLTWLMSIGLFIYCIQYVYRLLIKMSAIADFKSSLSLTRSKVLTFFLAIIGIAVVLGLVFVLVTLPIGLAAWLMNPSVDFITSWTNTITAWTLPLTSGDIGVVLSLSFLIVILPMSALGIWVLGALFGIAKEQIDTNDTRVEHAFSWLRKKFVPLIIGGILLSIIIVLPALVVGYIISWAYGFQTIPYPVSWIEGVVGFIYFFIMLGLFSLIGPAIIDDVSPINALKMSFRMVRANLARVYGFLLIIVIIAFVLVGPISLYSLYLVSLGLTPDIMTDVVFATFTAWTVIGAFILLLFIVPTLVFGLTVIYNSLKSPPQA